MTEENYGTEKFAFGYKSQTVVGKNSKYLKNHFKMKTRSNNGISISKQNHLPTSKGGVK